MRATFRVSITLGLLALLALPVSGFGQSIGDLASRISSTRAKLDDKREKQGVLSTEIEGYNTRISSLEGEIKGLVDQEAAVEERLEAKQAELERLRAELRRLRARLAKLQDKLIEAQKALASRLVALYKADEPDALTVVLQADGFADLLERTEFLERVSEQDQEIVTRVRTLKKQVEADEERVSGIETRVQAAAEEIAARRDQLVATRSRKQEAEGELTGARNDRRQALDQVEEDAQRLEGHLRDLEAEQARVEAQLAGTASSIDPGEIKQGSGSLIWPVNGPVSSPFGMRWGRLHAGIDISSPSGTPIRAADAGKVVIAAPTGGYGNYVCIQHGGSLSTCYAHLSSFGVGVGDSVGQGDVVGNVGCTGSCFGDHLHFETRVNGSPQDPMGYL